jgi:hypothetical protein
MPIFNVSTFIMILEMLEIFIPDLLLDLNIIS